MLHIQEPNDPVLGSESCLDDVDGAPLVSLSLHAGRLDWVESKQNQMICLLYSSSWSITHSSAGARLIVSLTVLKPRAVSG